MTAYMVVCAKGTEVVRVDYSEPGHPRNVHADGSICDHPGGVSIQERPCPGGCGGTGGECYCGEA